MKIIFRAGPSPMESTFSDKTTGGGERGGENRGLHEISIK